MMSLLLLVILGSANPIDDTDWPEYNGDGARSHYSPLSQITAGNVATLQRAWVYASGGADTTYQRTQMQCNPLIINGILYGVSAATQAFAVEAATGKQRWKTQLTETEGTTSRGVAYWSDGQQRTVFFGAGQWLYALDAQTGRQIEGFGDKGRINLQIGIQRPHADEYVVVNTPVTVYQNLIIVGARLSESESALLGDVRAYDARTGQLIWTFCTIPAPGTYGANTWPANARQNIGGANAWAGMAIDRVRGTVYVPTGSAAFDFYGGNRKGDNLFANCLLALDATTGKRLWHRQLVRHDVWDRDLPAPPNLLTIHKNGKAIEAVAQITKQGYIFVFDRVTGQPIYPMNEVSVPTDGVAGEWLSPKQYMPTQPTPFARQSFTEKDLNPFVADRDSIVALLRNARTGQAYLPITNQMTIFFPGTDGGGQWGGAATDPDGVLYVPSKEIPVYTSLIPKQNEAEGKKMTTGASLYRRYCAACHGKDLRGNHDGSYPSLIALEKRITTNATTALLKKGRGMMPSFAYLSAEEQQAITDYLFHQNADKQVVSSIQSVIPYQHTGYNRWYDRNGYPVSTPPWGTLTATDLNTGQRLWQVPLGEYPELTAKGIPLTGTDNYGGALVTGSGLIFIAATRDERLRVFDKKTGKLLWQTQLPAAGYASPSTYTVNGKQYVVIACGGGKLKTRSGDQYVAFALP